MVPAISAALTIMLTIVEYLKSLILRMFSSSSGADKVCWRFIKAARKDAPIIREARVMGWSHP